MKSAHASADSIDLNLLVALEVLVALGNVTRAAARLGITQSAMSHRLRRLRELLDDPVLVAGRQGLVATPRAERLSRVVSRSLREVRTALATAEHFDPSTSERRFTVVTTDFAEFEILPRVLEEFSRHAPRVTTVLREPFLGVVDALERGDVDLVVGPPLPATVGLVQRRVGVDSFASAARADHPIVKRRLDLETFLAVRHLVIDPGGLNATSAVDEALAKLGRHRDVAMRVPHFLGAPFIAARSDLLLTAPWALLRHAAGLLPLRVFEPPLTLPGQRAFMTWHERVNDDPGHTWLREVAARCTTAVLTGPAGRPKPGAPFEASDFRRDGSGGGSAPVSAAAARRPRSPAR